MAPLPLPGFSSFTKSWHAEPYPFISPTRPELSAAGKNIVITGGGTGIGQAAGIAFAQAGANSIAIVGRRMEHLGTSATAIQAANPPTRVLFETGDVTKVESIRTALKNIVDKVGKIDVFVANAGMLPKAGPVYGYDEAQLRQGLEINVIGAFNSLQAFLPIAAPDAKVIYTGSGIGHWTPMAEVPGVFSYAAAKAAALKMVDYFAFENPHIHVVSIQPGIIATGINPDLSVGFDTVELPAHFMVWLASNEAEFLKGKFVWANWDAQELLARAEVIKSTMLLRVTLNGIEM
ncbi:Short chain dehydrogenase citE [Fusarium oxysporum f. sp. rapae]|uniref:Short chain dehydrogenase citE n=1 Tax=Fusarium oxysporum f. sp. rapae TaxID=485398 RepID=A0A8J5P0A9_FUSOX|nr:Short chain dehydrogenase citE [Fusarium oxysporum f. sp. rapae]